MVGDIWYTQGGREVHTGFWWVNLKKRGHLESLHIKRRIISKHILKKLDWERGGNENWADLAQYRGKWNLFSMVMRVWVLKNGIGLDQNYQVVVKTSAPQS